ncbi:MAG: DUF1566 domain-containing protein [Alkalimonas sp.]|nr:DUF1566 domain-containing protein [Alkalimonas sp.]
MNQSKLFIATVSIYFLLNAHQAQANCVETIPATTPSHDFIDQGDGSVTHVVTGLTWMRCSLGQSWDGSTCTGSINSYSWQDALQVAQSYSYAGSSQWRLPKKNELASIIEERCPDPAINLDIFPNTPTYSDYWSSSPYGGSRYRAWIVNMSGNIVATTKTLERRVRLVRSAD